jgi:hypothetical protein
VKYDLVTIVAIAATGCYGSKSTHLASEIILSKQHLNEKYPKTKICRVNNIPIP